MIEKGRHTNVEREFRFCPFCVDRNVFSIEDEFHVFMIFPAYDWIRIQYFLPHWRQNITLHHFYNIMKLQSDDSIYAVSKFLIALFHSEILTAKINFLITLWISLYVYMLFDIYCGPKAFYY